MLLALVVFTFAAPYVSAATFEPQIGSWLFTGVPQICIADGCRATSLYEIRSMPDEHNADFRDAHDRGFAIQCRNGNYAIQYDVGRTFIGPESQMRVNVRISSDAGVLVNMPAAVEKDGYAGNASIVAPLSAADVAALSHAHKWLLVDVSGLQTYAAKADAIAPAIAVLREACEWRGQ